MKRYFPLVLLLALIVAPIALRRALLGKSSEQAPQANVPRLTIITPHAQDIRNEFRWAFADWHQKKYGTSVDIDYLTPGGTNDIQRQLEKTYSGLRDKTGALPPPDQMQSIGIDLAWGGGDFFYNVKLKPLGILQPLDLSPEVLHEVYPNPTLAGVKLYDQDKDKSGKLLPPRWVGICLSGFGIVYNSDLFRALDVPAPTTWTDLTSEKLHGAIALADPTHSSSASVTYVMIVQRAMADAEIAFFNLPENAGIDHAELKKRPAYDAAIGAGWKIGMQQLLRIAANARYFSDSSTQPPNDVAAGDAAAGMVIDFYGRVTEESVGPERCSYVSPPAATAIAPDPVAILYGTSGKKLELANHFIEFLLSPEGQRLWILKAGEPGGPRQRALRRSPARRDVYTDQTGWADDINYFTQAGNFNQRGEWMGMMSDLQPLWAAAWIDDREDLRAAYDAIRKVPDADKRAQLLAQLSDLPITLADVRKIPVERKKVAADPKGDLDRWNAESRIDWARKFREHYQAVGAKAQTSSDTRQQ